MWTAAGQSVIDMAKIDAHTEQVVLDLCLQNKTYKEIQYITGCSDSVIKRIKKRYGLVKNQLYEIEDDYAVIHIDHKGCLYKVKIDIEDVDKCRKLGRWCLTNAGYVFNSHRNILLSRYVMNCPDGLVVDHIYHDLLDNRKSQLRIITYAQNQYNRVADKRNTSGQRGVSWSNDRNKWCVYLRVKDERIAKRFDNYDEACEYARAVINNEHGEFAYDKCNECY